MPTRPDDAHVTEPLTTVTDEAQRDVALVRAASGGDRAAFAQLVKNQQSAVFGFLRARLLQSLDAEDLTQEVFLRCYQHLARFDGERVTPWLLGIARNVLREHLRTSRRRRGLGWTQMCLELEELAEKAVPDCDARVDQLPRCLDSLGTSARQAIEMRYDARMRLSEIGEKLRRSEGAAKLLMFRARQALKTCLDSKTAGTDV
jgi:RNA polymerase sigma-70 factor (ECF subfamily)